MPQSIIYRTMELLTRPEYKDGLTLPHIVEKLGTSRYQTVSSALTILREREMIKQIPGNKDDPKIHGSVPYLNIATKPLDSYPWREGFARGKKPSACAIVRPSKSLNEKLKDEMLRRKLLWRTLDAVDMHTYDLEELRSLADANITVTKARRMAQDLTRLASHITAAVETVLEKG